MGIGNILVLTTIRQVKGKIFLLLHGFEDWEAGGKHGEAGMSLSWGKERGVLLGCGWEFDIPCGPVYLRDSLQR